MIFLPITKSYGKKYKKMSPRLTTRGNASLALKRALAGAALPACDYFTIKNENVKSFLKNKKAAPARVITPQKMTFPYGIVALLAFIIS